MEEKFIKILNKKDCTGCRACEQICPVKAISMKEDDEGFITPKVDEERCIKCGLCKKTCGQIDRFYNKNNLEERNELEKMLKEKFPTFEYIIDGHVGAALSCYLGSGLLGVAIQFI